MFPCYNCDSKFGTYSVARAHYEKCTSSESDTSMKQPAKLSFHTDKVNQPPLDLKYKEWTENKMLKYISWKLFVF